MTDTSIRLDSDTRDRLRAAKQGGEKYDETINRLLDQADALDGRECDECGDEFNLAEVAIFHRGSDDERVVCTDCLTPEDRIIG